MKEVHLTNASIPGVRCLREMNASTNKRRRDTTYTSKVIEKTAAAHLMFETKLPVVNNMIGNRKAIPVRTAEETRHSIASGLEGKLKNHPTQCIPPNTRPTTDIQMTPTSSSVIPPESEA